MSAADAKKAKRRKARKTAKTNTGPSLNTISFESLPSPKPASSMKNLPEVIIILHYLLDQKNVQVNTHTSKLTGKLKHGISIDVVVTGRELLASRRRVG